MSALEAIRAPLFVPADRSERFAKAAASGTDAIILDLEDAVADGAKDAARAALRRGFIELPVIVRINAIRSTAFESDLAAVATLRPDAIMLPKAEGADQIGSLTDVLPYPVIALIESARALANARAIAAAKGVALLAFGSIDLRRSALRPYPRGIGSCAFRTRFRVASNGHCRTARRGDCAAL